MKTIIWDYNGTIIDDVDITVRIENEMLQRRSLPGNYTKADYQELFTIPLVSYYRKIGYTFTEETYDDIAIEYNELYDRYFPMCSVYDGVREKLEESLQKGYRNVILSSCNHTKLVQQITSHGLAGYFTEIMGLDDLLAGSKVAMAKKWAKDQSVSGEDCLYLGDTLADLETARALQVKNCFLIAQGHQSYAKLKEHHDRVVHSIYEVEL